MSYLTPQQALDLALNHHRAGRLAEAETIYRGLYRSDPHNADLVHLLGMIASHARRHQEARELMERSVAMAPGVPRYHNNLGTLLLDMREYDRAIACYEQALRLDPSSAGTFYNIGLARFQLRQWPASIDAYQTALRLDSNFPSCELNLGTTYAAAGQLDRAIALYRDVLRRRPNDGAIATNLGNLLKERGELDDAVEVYRLAMQIDPNDSITCNNLAVALKDQGEIEAAIAAFRRSLDLRPEKAEVRSNLILTMLFDPRIEPAALAAEERRWNEHHAAPLRPQRLPHPNDRSPDRRLRIGYLSADLRDHVVGRALLPVFERHDREKFEPVCYSMIEPDATTRRFMAGAALWRDVAGMPGGELAALIRADGIDILVDLALHTSDNRLRVFARKPAPVQVSWLGYPGSSGVETIDYRISDPFLEPPGGESAPSAEQPLRLPHCWSCYEPPADSPAVNELPALACGHVTFGSLNNFCKINGRVLEVWTRILEAVEGSRLVLLTKSGSHRARLAGLLSQRGIASERLDFLDYHSSTVGCSQGSYLSRYSRIDLALDTFPYNGMTTTFDALWMGVPVIALVGKLSLGRAGLSLLSNAGLSEFAVETQEEYVRRAVDLARDLPRLAALRATLRSRMENSPLLDADSLAREVEKAFRTMWRCWSAGER